MTKIVCAKGNNSGAKIDKIIHSLKIPSEICDKLTESCDESLNDTDLVQAADMIETQESKTHKQTQLPKVQENIKSDKNDQSSKVVTESKKDKVQNACICEA